MRVIGVLLVAVGLAAVSAARAEITCRQSSGDPGRETTVRVSIDWPASGDVIEPTTGCGGAVHVAGRFEVDAPPPLFDFYVVIDASGSTDSDSGADVDGDGLFGGRGDTIYQAEITAAEEFIRAMDPSASRVAVIRFNRDAILEQALTPDLAAAVSVLETMRGSRPRWGTGYVGAMEAVRLEVLARGDRANREQRCVFLSDGVPDEPLAQTDAKARELAALGVVMDTFALGFPDSEALRSMAAITGGSFTALARPGDVVALLPSFIPSVSHVLDSREELSGVDGVVSVDDASGTFAADVTLHPGSNRVSITLTAASSPPVSVTCTIDLTMTEPLVADAGPPSATCGGAAHLDATRSFAACSPLHRWLDCNGVVLRDWTSSPLLDVDACALPCETVTLELKCVGDPCVASATTTASCLASPRAAPTVASSCALHADVRCGASDSSLETWWDLDPATDADGDGDAANDADLFGCDVALDAAHAGMQDLVAWARDPSSGCASYERLSFELSEPPPPRSLDGGICPGVDATFSCGMPAPGSTQWWDFDEATDADLDGDPTDDRDALGCDAVRAWPVAGDHVVTGSSEDASGCRVVLARGVVTVSEDAVPAEVADLRVARAGDAVSFTWTPVAGAATHRVVRGDLLPLHASGSYDHAADEAASRGACSAAASFTDPDDAADARAFYYLVVAVSPCGGEGPSGFAFDGHDRIPRPDRVGTRGCP